MSGFNGNVEARLLEKRFENKLKNFLTNELKTLYNSQLTEFKTASNEDCDLRQRKT
ncbi:hypothetical protein THMIRHAT_18250 [Thiosulfativibrio zosterae]|uniref:Uncharacterized protein n=1 Tax=Thiosulfativibrio zosterae TaxID=2675053 RepID=A0A6F8PK72_9GAMM|nr:hypothetical protein THMIRHAT_02490 [Thiosulfativibrio zosterae]BBP44079.1 hypothetical protein THMIRHAT_18250 [Thiosulfativibrio zosterae]